MTTIKTSCPVCGDVELDPGADAPGGVHALGMVLLLLQLRRPARTRSRSRLTSEVVTLLVSGGVVAEHWVIPAEALEEHAGSAITYDDVLDFALGLDRVDLLAAMITPRVGA